MLGIELDRNKEIQLSRQIYNAIREDILDGSIKAGEIIPSTRELAKHLLVSRNTVCEAYEMLIAEGFIITHQGARARVGHGLTMEKGMARPQISRQKEKRSIVLADFKTGQPDLREFPYASWNKIYCRVLQEMLPEVYGYSRPEGVVFLREEIASWLFRSRGIKVNAEDIFITAGATHGLHLLSSILYKKGKEFLIEDPCHTGMRHVLEERGFRIRPVPVDSAGIKTEYLDGKDASAIYVTPSHQFPLGGILAVGRRIELIQYARQNDMYIIEDDYDSEFRYLGEPVAPLFSMDPQRVIYVGTFSKILFPALRIGYVILPHRLQKDWKYLRTHTDVQNPPFEQLVLAEFLSSRKLDRHVHRMKKMYGERRKVLLEELGKNFGKAWTCIGDASGLHLSLYFSNMIFDDEFLRKSRENGIRITSVDYHSIKKGLHRDKLLIGYGHLEPEEIHNGVEILHNFIQVNAKHSERG